MNEKPGSRFDRNQHVGGLQQVVWLSIEVPPSGKAADLARALMSEWDRATGGSRFSDRLAKDRVADPMGALEEWRTVASSHFLGVLHLDEVQNLFKLNTLRQRRSRKGTDGEPELSIVEDQVLRWLLKLTNSGQIPLLVSGTPDGIGALSKRLSTLERLHTGGYFAMDYFRDAASPEFKKSFLDQLGQYQYVKTPVPVDHELAKLIIHLTGGIPRIIISLWIAAHRVAFDRKEDSLRLDDFKVAARTFLAPLAPAVAALRSGDPSKISKYEDLANIDLAFLTEVWQIGA